MNGRLTLMRMNSGLVRRAYGLQKRTHDGFSGTGLSLVIGKGLSERCHKGLVHSVVCP